MIVSETLDFYLQSSKHVVDQNRLEVIIKHLDGLMGDMHISEIGPAVCQKYGLLRKEQKTLRRGEYHPTADSTIARELGVLKSAARHALKWKKILNNDMPTFDMPKNLPKNEIWLHKDELQRLFDATGSNMVMKTYLVLLYVTASRRGAIEKLEWSQVDFERRIIHLNKPGQAATKKRRPTVPMGKSYDILQQMYENKQNKYVLGNNTDRYRQFNTLLKRANLVEVEERDGRPKGYVTPHVLRHTRATHLLESGMSIYSVAQLLGDNATTVEKIYAHACTKTLNDELEKFS